MARSYLSKLSLLLTVAFLCQFDRRLIAVAQQAPFVSVEKFDRSVTYRTNVCDRQRQLWNNSIELPDALRGLNLTVAITNYQLPNENAFFTLVNGRIKPKDPGLFAVIMDEVARRAGFHWRKSFAVFDPLNSTTDGNKTWTDILEWSVETFDVSVEKWGRGVERMALGISFPAGWWDSSIVLGEQIGKTASSQRVFNLWSFLEPFTLAVWLAIAAAIVLTGLVYWVLEYLDVRRRLTSEGPFVCIFDAAIAFTGHFESSPKTQATQILSFSWTFWALIVVSSYTANLASFLVSPRITIYKYTTMEDVLRRDVSVCVQANAFVHNLLEKRYKDLRLVPKESEDDIFKGLRLDVRNGGCDAFAHQFNSFEMYERSKKVNYDCSISSEKRVVEIVEAGLATAIDAGPYRCTSLISHVLDYYLLEMRSDGFIERAWKKHVDKLSTIECVKDLSQTGGGGGEDDTFRLTLRDVGGIFIVHILTSVFAVALAFFHFYRNRGEDQRSLCTVFGITQAKQAIARRRGINSSNAS